MSLDIIVYIFSGGVGGGIVSFLLKSWFETRLKTVSSMSMISDYLS